MSLTKYYSKLASTTLESTVLGKYYVVELKLVTFINFSIVNFQSVSRKINLLLLEILD